MSTTVASTVNQGPGIGASATFDHRRALLVSTAIWGAAAVYTFVRSWLLGRWLGLDEGFLPTLGAELRALLAWALATPLIVASAHRFPLARATWPRSLMVHLAGAATFIYLLQIVVDSPNTLSGEWSIGTALRNAGIAFLDNFHLAGLVYGIILAVTFVLDARRRRQVAAEPAPDDESAPPPAASAPHAPALVRDRLAVKSGEGVLVVDVGDIAWIEADGDYAKLHVGGRVVMLRETLKALEERLDPERFLRIHRSSIVNVERVRRLDPFFHGDYAVVLDDGTELRLSRTYREALAARLDHPL